LQHDPSTRYSAQGVIAIDDTLIDHEGKLIEDVGWFWDHADKRHLIAHDYLIANYVCTSGKHYALEFRRFRKSEDCQAWQAELAQREGGVQAASEKEQRLATFKSHTELFKELVDGVVEWQIPGDFALLLLHERRDPQPHQRHWARLHGGLEIQPQGLVQRDGEEGVGDGQAHRR
jgi:hypothetical protein